MFYTIFVKKEKGYKGASPLSIILNLFFKKFCNDEIILCLPGYMCTNQKGINHFFSNLKFPKKSHVEFLYGMNGKTELKKGWTILDEYNYKVHNRKYFIEKIRDHSKMMILIKNIGLNNLCDENSKKLCIELNDDIETKMVLIGSSNQSDNTYFGPTAHYGEADIIIIDTDTFDNINKNALKEFYNKLDSNIKKNVVISEDIMNDKFNKNFLNNIYAKTVKLLKS